MRANEAMATGRQQVTRGRTCRTSRCSNPHLVQTDKMNRSAMGVRGQGTTNPRFYIVDLETAKMVRPPLWVDARGTGPMLLHRSNAPPQRQARKFDDEIGPDHRDDVQDKAHKCCHDCRGDA